MGMTKVRSEEAVDTVLEVLKRALKHGERIELRGFGVFLVKPRKSGIGRNPRDGSRGPHSSRQDRSLQTRERNPLRLTPQPPDEFNVSDGTFSPRREPAGAGNGETTFPAGPSVAARHLRHNPVGRVALARQLYHEQRSFLTRHAGLPSGWPDLLLGLPYSITVLAILLAHEMGHYLACRYYGIRATLPYAIPAPFPFPFGTMGAVIRIKSPFRDRRQLFDVGIAGPLAGFVLIVPALIIGLGYSTDFTPPQSRRNNLRVRGTPALPVWPQSSSFRPERTGTSTCTPSAGRPGSGCWPRA